MNSCEKFDSLIEEYLDGALSNEENKQFLEHISSCEKCRAALDMAKKMHQALNSLDYCLDVPDDFVSNLHRKIEKAPKRRSLITYTSRMGAIAACVVLVCVVARNGIDTRLVKNAQEQMAEDSAGVVMTEIAKDDTNEATFAEEANTTETTEDKEDNIQRKITATDAAAKKMADTNERGKTKAVNPEQTPAPEAALAITKAEPQAEASAAPTDEKQALMEEVKAQNMPQTPAMAALETADVMPAHDAAVSGISEQAEEVNSEHTTKMPEEPVKVSSGGGGGSSAAVRRMVIFELKVGIDDIEKATAVADKFTAPQNGIYTLSSEMVQKLLSELEKEGIKASLPEIPQSEEISFTITAR